MKTIKNTKLILVFPRTGDWKSINDMTNKDTINMTVAMILVNVIFVGRFIIVFPFY